MRKEYEKRILGMMLLDNKLYTSSILNENDFDGGNKLIYRAIGKIINAGNKADIIIISDELQGEIKSSYICELTNIGSSANFEYYEKQLKEISRKDKLRKLCMLLMDSLKEKDSHETINIINEKITELESLRGSEIKKIKDYLPEIFKHYEKVITDGFYIEGLQTGFDMFDKEIGGLRDGELIIIVARPGIGKTAIAINIILRLILRNISVGIFSLEMSAESLIKRMISCIASIATYRSEKGKMGQIEFEKLLDNANYLQKTELYLCDNNDIKISELKNKARYMKQMGIQVLFVDYITLIKMEHAYNKSMPERIGEIAKELKRIARELNIPVVALSQLNREAENEMPKLSQLRQSGAIEEDADVVIFLHRKRDEDITKVIVAKNRNWSTGECQLLFERPYSRFNTI